MQKTGLAEIDEECYRDQREHNRVSLLLLSNEQYLLKYIQFYTPEEASPSDFQLGSVSRFRNEDQVWKKQSYQQIVQKEVEKGLKGKVKTLSVQMLKQLAQKKAQEAHKDKTTREQANSLKERLFGQEKQMALKKDLEAAEKRDIGVECSLGDMEDRLRQMEEERYTVKAELFERESQGMDVRGIYEKWEKVNRAMKGLLETLLIELSSTASTCQIYADLQDMFPQVALNPPESKSLVASPSKQSPVKTRASFRDTPKTASPIKSLSKLASEKTRALEKFRSWFNLVYLDERNPGNIQVNQDCIRVLLDVYQQICMPIVPCADEVEKNVAKYFSDPPESQYCICSICLGKYALLEKGKDFLRKSSSIFRLDASKYRQFYKFVAPVEPGKIFCKLQIPTMCFFDEGDDRTVFGSKGGVVQMIILKTEQLKDIPNHFTDSRRMRAPRLIDGKKENHIKFFDSVVPSYKHGISNENLENAPTHFRFHCSKKSDEDGQLLKITQSSVSEIVVVKFRKEGFEMLNEKQLRNLLKTPAKHASIDFIQAYVKPHEQHSQLISIEYNGYLKPTNPYMFERSLLHVKESTNLLSKFSAGYLPLQQLDEYESVLKDIPEDYCLYQSYRLVHYMQLQRGIKVLNLTTVWFRDEFDEICFFGVLNFQFEQSEVLPDVTQINQLKMLIASEFSQLETELMGAWENMKKRKIKVLISQEEKQTDLEQKRLINEIKVSNQKKKGN